MIVVVGIAGVVVIVMCDGNWIESINMIATLIASWSSDSSPSHMGVCTPVHSASSRDPDEVPLAFTIERANLSYSLEFYWRPPISPLL